METLIHALGLEADDVTRRRPLSGADTVAYISEAGLARILDRIRTLNEALAAYVDGDRL